MKIKIKVKIADETVKAKVLIFSPMYTKKLAKNKGVEQDYITHITAYVNDDRVVFEFIPTVYVSKNPLFKFRFKRKDIKIGDSFTVKWTTLQGVSESASYLFK